MIKKFSFLILGFMLAGCSTSISTKGGAEQGSTDISEVNFGDTENFRVGVLLPLSGRAASHGQGLKNATLMAMDDVKNPKLILQFYDTKSTASGARVAVENALNQNSKLILGPLMSDSVRAISDQTTSRGVPVIAFSTSNEVLQPNVFTLGLLIDEQIDRVMTYSVEKGRSRFALLVPDNNTGIAVAKAAIKSAQKNNVQVVKIGFYRPQTTDFTEILKQMTDYDSRKARLNSAKASLEAQAKQGNSEASKSLRRLKTLDSIGDVDFDAVIIPENGPRLKSAVSMFGYYDVFAPKVQFLGTSIWENTVLNKESVMRGGLYPAMSHSYSAYFSNKYAEIFGEKPNSIYSLAYDGVALASVLSKLPANSDLNAEIINKDGYAGINGAFRLFKNGTNEHSLDIYEVRENGDVIVDEAPKKFVEETSYQDNLEIITDDDFVAPQIYGKDNSIAQHAIFGYQLGNESQRQKYLSEIDNEGAEKSRLDNLRIVIPEI